VLSLTTLERLSELEYDRLAEAHPEFFTLLERVLAHYETVMASMETLVPLSGNQALSPLGQLQSYLTQAQKAADAASAPSGVYKSLHALERRIMGLAHVEPSVLRDLPAAAAAAMAAFERSYDAFLSSRNPKTTLALLRSAYIARQSLQDLSAAAQAIVAAFTSRDPVPQGHQEVTISFHSAQKPDEIARKLRAISELYSELALLLGVSEIDFPLVVRQLHSGSLLITVLGSTVVVGLLTKVVVSSAKWVYGHATTDNRLASIPKGLDALNRAIGIREKLSASGRDTSNLDAMIDKAAVNIASALNDLFEDEPQIQVDGDSIGLISDEAQRVLEHRKPKQLPRGSSQS
jgi:hypothetical protein